MTGEHELPETTPIDGQVGVEAVSTRQITVVGELLDIAEKGGKTFAQTLLIYLGAGATVSVLDVPWGIALQGSLIATILTVVVGLAQTAWTSTNPYIEALARAARTFLVSFAGAIPVVNANQAYVLADVPWGQAAGIAGTLAVVSILTSLGSLRIGRPGSPSLVR